MYTFLYVDCVFLCNQLNRLTIIIQFSLIPWFPFTVSDVENKRKRELKWQCGSGCFESGHHNHQSIYHQQTYHHPYLSDPEELSNNSSSSIEDEDDDDDNEDVDNDGADSPEPIHHQSNCTDCDI